MVSSLSSPIASHFNEKVRIDDDVGKPVPRVRPEAQKYAERDKGSIGGVMLQVTGQNSFQPRPQSKPKCKDHLSENHKRIRKIQRAARQKCSDENQVPAMLPLKPCGMTKKYANVQSKVFTQLNQPSSRPQSARPFLKAHEKTYPIQLSKKRPSSARSVPGEAAVPRLDKYADVKLVRRDIDYVRANALAVRAAGMKHSPSAMSIEEGQRKRAERYDKFKKGELPDYLLKRREEWKDEEQRRKNAQPDKDQPPGHTKMPDKERLETLETLRAREKELMREILSLPLRMDTHRLQCRKADLECKLSEVEEAIRIFSRPRVFVKIPPPKVDNPDQNYSFPT